MVKGVQGTFPRACGIRGTRRLKGIKLRMERDILGP